MNMTRRQCFATTGFGLLCRAADDPLLDEWRKIAAETDGVAGCAAHHLKSGRHVSLHGDDRFPLASVCKLPIAIAVFAMVAEGKLSLQDEIEVPLYDVNPNVSPLAERWGKQKRFPLEEMVSLMVAKSDNTAVQTLFRVAGGGPGIAARMRAWQIDGVRLDRDERTCGLEMAGVKNIPPVSTWTPKISSALTANIPPAERIAAMRRFLEDPRDTGTPNGSVALLRKLYGGDLLPAPLTARLRSILESTTTGPARIKGLLPAGTTVAHKTGTTGTAGKLNGSTNDVGVITLPGGAQLAVAFYLKGSTPDDAARERTIARLARAAYDWATA
jgi:beta-lactamase class A